MTVSGISSAALTAGLEDLYTPSALSKIGISVLKKIQEQEQMQAEALLKMMAQTSALDQTPKPQPAPGRVDVYA